MRICLSRNVLRKEERIQQMKNKKSALALVAILVACGALTACDRATSDNSGSVLTYTDAQGNVVSYTAADLLESYQNSGSSISTEFDKIYEVLIRKYYEDDSQASVLSKLKKNATVDVETDKSNAKTNATSNKTTYEEEFQKILDSNSCDNIDELYEYHLYKREKERYEQNYNDSNREALRDGASSANGGLLNNDDSKYLLNASSYGRLNKGWIKEQLPYHVRHILVKVSASAGEYTQGQLTEDASSAGEATKLSGVVMRLAGADPDNSGSKVATNRETFGEIAYNSSEDTSSATNFGELDNPMTKVMSSDLVPEFKLGIYAYETLYNEKTSSTTFGQSNVASLTPGLVEDATSTTQVDPDQTIDDNGKTINQFFKDGETYDDSTSGIGQIPYGAAVALYNSAKITNDNGTPVYEGNATFYPRNILFNKYFNKHNVCVITPNDIAYNDSSIDPESSDGVYNATYGALPGFSKNTTSELSKFTHNVLTDEQGHIVLAVRAGASSYQGVHFIVVQRSALDYYGNYASSTTDGVADLSQYYTYYRPGEESYPTDTSGNDLTTYVKYAEQQSSDYHTRASRISTAVNSYNTSLSTYVFSDLVSNGSLKFKDTSMEKRIQTYSVTKRQSSVDDNFTTWSNNWKTYAEMIEQQNIARNATFPTGYTGNSTSKDHMLSEVCAIGYTGADKATDADWQKGGRCYYVK
jgi:hypothetical protein